MNLARALYTSSAYTFNFNFEEELMIEKNGQCISFSLVQGKEGIASDVMNYQGCKVNGIGQEYFEKLYGTMRNSHVNGVLFSKIFDPTCLG